MMDEGIAARARLCWQKADDMMKSNAPATIPASGCGRADDMKKTRSAAKGLPLLSLALLLLAPLAFPQFSEFREHYGEQFENNLTGNWMHLAIVAITICVLFNALLYMVGFALQSESIKRYAKSEFMQVSASSLLIFFAVALVYTLADGTTGISGLDFMGQIIGEGSTVSCGAVTGGAFHIWEDSKFGTGPIGAFKCKLQEKITALDKAYDNVYQANMGKERLNSMCISLFGAPVWCWDWDLALHAEVEQNHLVASKIVGLLVPIHAQFSLAEYLQRNMLAVFLPAGLVLRIFPLTRGVGGLFIAMAVGFFFVWPTFVILTDPTFVKVSGTMQDRQAGKCFTGFKGTAVLLSSMDFGESGSQDALATAQGTDLVYQITVAALFYPFVSLVVTLIFIRAITPLLGGDTGELMKMVSRLG